MSKRYELRATFPGNQSFTRDFWTQGEATSAFEVLRDFLVVYWPCVDHDAPTRLRKINGLPFASLTRITPGQDAVPFVLEVVDTEEPSRR